jgi:hypothetical protein
MSEYRLLGASSLNCVVVNMNFIYLLVIKYVIHYVVVYFIKSCNYPEHDHIYLSSSLGVIPFFMISYTIYRFTISDLITNNTYQKLYANRRSLSCDRMVVGFTATCVISATTTRSLNPAYGKVYSIQHYVIKFVSDLRRVSGFLHQ